MAQLALSFVAALLTLTAAAAEPHPFTAPSAPTKFKTAVNQKGFQTYNVTSRLKEQFTSIQHCLPIQLNLLENQNETVLDYALFSSNSTSLEGSYNIHPYVENGQLVRSCTSNTPCIIPA